MEKRIPGTFEGSEFLKKHRKKGNGAHQLDDQRGFQNECRQPYDSADLGRRNGLLHSAALHQADPPP